MVEAMGLKTVASRSPLMASINVMKIYQAVQKWWFDKPTFIFGK
jgi:hypothetical protein